MPAQRGFGEDQVTVEDHLEAALRRRQQVDRLDDRRPSGEQFVRQTDGPWHVISGDAEFDREAVAGIEHPCSLRVAVEEFVLLLTPARGPRTVCEPSSSTTCR